MNKVLRPGSCTYALPERKVEPPARPQLSPQFIAAYDGLTASETRYKYDHEPAFAVLVDELLKQRGI
jgi:hypothetical protein